MPGRKTRSEGIERRTAAQYLRRNPQGLRYWSLPFEKYKEALANTRADVVR
jgi:hypothetical protein